MATYGHNSSRGSDVHSEGLSRWTVTLTPGSRRLSIQTLCAWGERKTGREGVGGREGERERCFGGKIALILKKKQGVSVEVS